MPSFYERRILPRVIHHVCGLGPMTKQREKVIPHASGVILELGIGSGHNLQHYNPDKVSHVIGIDPTPDKRKLEDAQSKAGLSFELIERSAESLDLDDKSIDTVVCTYVLCTIPDVISTLEACRRVLKPSGKLLFVEHGQAPDVSVRKTQDRLNSIWSKVAGGCQLNRDIPAMLQQAGYKVPGIESMYLPGWKPATWNVWGAAVLG